MCSIHLKKLAFKLMLPISMDLFTSIASLISIGSCEPFRRNLAGIMFIYDLINYNINYYPEFLIQVELYTYSGLFC